MAKYNFGEVTRMLMSAQGMRTADLSEKTGIDAEYLDYCLYNEVVPSMKEVRLMARALGVSADFLASGVDNTSYPSRKCSSFKASYVIAKNNVHKWNFNQKMQMIKLMTK